MEVSINKCQKYGKFSNVRGLDEVSIGILLVRFSENFPSLENFLSSNSIFSAYLNMLHIVVNTWETWTQIIIQYQVIILRYLFFLKFHRKIFVVR